MDSITNAPTLQLLRELDERQEQVLQELDRLNERIEIVLEGYLNARRPEVGQNGLNLKQLAGTNARSKAA